MCDNGKYFFYVIRLVTKFLSFIIYFKKNQSYKKEQTNAVKGDGKTRIESNTSLLNAFLAPLSIKFMKNYSLDQLESHKRDLYYQESTGEIGTLKNYTTTKSSGYVFLL